MLNDEDKLLVMDCAQSSICSSYILSNEVGLYEWLSMIHGKQIKSRLNHLMRKAFIHLEDGTTRIDIHDLWREFFVMESKVGELKSHCWIHEELSGSNDPSIEESNVYRGVLERAQRISLIGTYARPCNMHLNFSRCSWLVALHLIHVHLEGNVLDLNGMYNLKSLLVQINSNWEVRGLGSLRQLCILEWHGEMPSNMTFN